jgi:hypothetical protein
MQDHKTRLIRFLLLFAILILYLAFISFKYGVRDGFAITLLTWSFFVLCTPIADAGFLLDFPIRLLFKIRMLYSEIVVWLVAISANAYFFLNSLETYYKTLILMVFHHILTQPYPFWSIIALSFIGTFLSIHLADELFDMTLDNHHSKYKKHKNLHQIIVFVFVVGMIVVLYDFLIKQLNIDVPL